MKDILKQAKEAQNCIDWHPYCDAECCQQYSIKLQNNFNRKLLRKGKTIVFEIKEEKDTIWLFRLMGLEYKDGKVIIKLNKFKVKGNLLTIFSRCSKLTDDNLCSIHEKPRPEVCTHVREDTAHEAGKKFQITRNCLFRYKLMLKGETT